MRSRTNLKWLVASRDPRDLKPETRNRKPETHPQKPLPKAPALARNFAQAMGRTVAGALRGQPVRVSADEQARRKGICEGCTGSDGWYLAGTERCAHPKCGCYLRFKTWLARENCPAGRW